MLSSPTYGAPGRRDEIKNWGITYRGIHPILMINIHKVHFSYLCWLGCLRNYGLLRTCSHYIVFYLVVYMLGYSSGAGWMLSVLLYRCRYPFCLGLLYEYSELFSESGRKQMYIPIGNFGLSKVVCCFYLVSDYSNCVCLFGCADCV